MDALTAFGAFGLGLATVAHPCPLTTNLASLSLVPASGGGLARNLAAALALASGQILAYGALGVALSYGALSVPWMAETLPQQLKYYLGPLLILVGMLQTGLLRLPRGWSLAGHAGRFARAHHWNLAGTFVLGIVLALAFCPATGVLFFGTLLPSAVASGSPILFPLFFATGTALPLCALAATIASSVSLGKQLKRAPGRLVGRVPLVAGSALILFGLWLTWLHLLA